MPPSDAARFALDEKLLEAHAQKDHAALIALYLDAADMSDQEDAVAFYLTHAYVFALESADLRAADIKARLVAMGRER